MPFSDEVRPVTLVDYQPSWVDDFERLRAQLRALDLGCTGVLDHIGSTSVPGLCAKDVIDARVRLPTITDDAVIAAFAAIGFRNLYCGTITDTNLWTGRGTFLFTASGGTFGGDTYLVARVPTAGGPLPLTISRGTGTYEGAHGSCLLNDHIKQIAFGVQEQSGTFTCAIAFDEPVHDSSPPTTAGLPLSTSTSAAPRTSDVVETPKCPSRFTETNASSPPTAGQLVPFPATTVRICKYDFNGPLKGSAVASGAVASRIEAELNAFVHQTRDFVPTCPRRVRRFSRSPSTREINT